MLTVDIGIRSPSKDSESNGPWLANPAAQAFAGAGSRVDMDCQGTRGSVAP